MGRKRFLFILFSLIAGYRANAGGTFEFSSSCIKAQQEIFHLRLDQAGKMLDQARKQVPNSLVPDFLEGYIDFFEGFISENESLFKEQEDAYKKRLESMKKGDRKSPYYLFTQAELKMQRAIVRLKFGEYVNAAMELNNVYKELKENSKKFPDFKPNGKTMGLLEVMIGTVPSKYQWAVNTIGLEGNIEQGIKKLTDFINTRGLKPEEEVIRDEALFMLAFIRLHITKDPAEAWEMIEKGTADYSANLLHAYVRAAIAKGAKKNDEAIRVLSRRPTGKELYSFYYLEYMLGVCKMQKLDQGAAIHFIRYVTYFKGKNYIKESYQRLAWLAALQGDREVYERYLSMVQRYGSADVDEDKVALRSATDTRMPDLRLLKSRLLFDGGYYPKAYDILYKVDEKSLALEKEKLERVYRLGRICHEWGRTSEATGYYQETINRGRNMSYYFAANSSLNLGLIYEKTGKYELARKYYKDCSNFKHNKEYQGSIENKAKAGLKRIEGK